MEVFALLVVTALVCCTASSSVIISKEDVKTEEDQAANILSDEEMENEDDLNAPFNLLSSEKDVKKDRELVTADTLAEIVPTKLMEDEEACFEDNIDYSSHDVPAGIAQTESWQTCGQWCQATAQCLAWSWGKDSHPNPNVRGKCFLKTATYASGRKSEKGVISGQKDCPACVRTTGGTAQDACCHFPFTYDGKLYKYKDCTKKDNDKAWCYTTPDDAPKWETRKWGNCVIDGKKKEKKIKCDGSSCGCHNGYCWTVESCGEGGWCYSSGKFGRYQRPKSRLYRHKNVQYQLCGKHNQCRYGWSCAYNCNPK